MAYIVGSSKDKPMWLSIAVKKCKITIYQSMDILEKDRTLWKEWPTYTGVIEQCIRNSGGVCPERMTGHKREWVGTWSTPRTASHALRLAEFITNMLEAKSIHFIKFDLKELRKAAAKDEPSEAERIERDATMSGLLKRHDVTITEKEREALVEDEGSTLREAKAVLDDIRALKERSKLGKLTKAMTVKKSAKELLDRIGKISAKQAEAEARWKVEGMADDGTLDCRALMKLLVDMERRREL
jgi:hypothetical protein